MEEALKCLGKPDSYNVYVIDNPEGTTLMLMLWYPAKGVALTSHSSSYFLRPRLNSFNEHTELEDLYVFKPAPVSEMVKYFYSDAFQMIILKTMQSWPDQVKELMPIDQ